MLTRLELELIGVHVGWKRRGADTILDLPKRRYAHTRPFGSLHRVAHPVQGAHGVDLCSVLSRCSFDYCFS